MLPIEQMSSQPRQSSARERRRWKQLEEMARNPRVRNDRLVAQVCLLVAITSVHTTSLVNYVLVDTNSDYNFY